MCRRRLSDLGGDVAELGGGTGAEELDRHDAHDCDEGDEQRVLDEARTTLVPGEPGTEVGGDGLLEVGNEVHRGLLRYPLYPTCPWGALCIGHVRSARIGRQAQIATRGWATAPTLSCG